MPNPKEKVDVSEKRSEAVWSLDEVVNKLKNVQKGSVMTLYLSREHGNSQKVKESIESKSGLKVRVESYPSLSQKPGIITHIVTLE